MKQSLIRELSRVALAYTILAVVMTWPVIGHLTEAIAGFEGRDSLQIVWFHWWSAKSLLALQSSPAQVDWLYYPQGADHPLLLATLFVPLLATPLTLLFGPVTAYNLMFLGSFTLGGLLTYLFVRALVRQRWAAFLAGVIVIFAPNRMGHALAGHLLLITTWSFPLFALALTYLIRKPSWRWVGVGGVALAVLTLTQPLHLAYFALPLSLIYGGGLLLRQPNLRHTVPARLPYALGTGALATLLLLPFFGPLLTATQQGALSYITNEGLVDHSTDLLAFGLASPYHPLWGDVETPPALLAQVINSPRAMEEGLAYLGLVPVALAGWAVWRGRPGVWLWLLLAGLMMLLSLGPTLKMMGNDTGWPLPYLALTEVPFLKWSRTPGRLNETTTLALAVLAALGLADLLTRLETPLRKSVVAGLAVAVILFEYLPLFPFPLAGQISHDIYPRLAIEAPGQPLLDMPVAGSRRASNYSLLYQTIHDRPIVGGYVQRELPNTEEAAQFYDRLLSPTKADKVVTGLPTIETRQQILKESGIRQVTARRWLMTDRGATETLDFMPRVLGTAYHVDENLLAWQPPPVEFSLPDYTLLLSEDGWESIGGGAALELKEEGLLFIYAAHPGSAHLTLEVTDGHPGQQLWVGQTGPLAATAAGQRHQISLEMAPAFNWLPFRLTGCDNCRAVFSHISIEAGGYAAQ